MILESLLQNIRTIFSENMKPEPLLVQCEVVEQIVSGPTKYHLNSVTRGIPSKHPSPQFASLHNIYKTPTVDGITEHLP